MQGVGGAVVTAVALALINNLFTEDGERAKAMGVYSFVCAVGGSLGEVLGGVLTDTFGWASVFLVNLPIGLGVYLCCLRLLPADAPQQQGRLDVAGAVTITLALMFAVYAVVDGNHAGWGSVQTLGLFTAAAILFAAFLRVESRALQPLVPLGLFRLRNLATANVVAVLWAAGMFAWFVVAALYLQRVLGYSPTQVGFAFIPADVIMAAFSLGLSAKVVMRYGIRAPIWIGLGVAAAGLAWLARAPLQGDYGMDVLPSMLLLGVGAGMAFNPVLLAAMNDVDSKDSGLASGVVNTSFMMGGALGLAVLASLADAKTAEQTAAGVAALPALNDGYRLAFWVGTLVTAAGALLAWTLIRDKPK